MRKARAPKRKKFEPNEPRIQINVLRGRLNTKRSPAEFRARSSRIFLMKKLEVEDARDEVHRIIHNLLLHNFFADPKKQAAHMGREICKIGFLIKEHPQGITALKQISPQKIKLILELREKIRKTHPEYP